MLDIISLSAYEKLFHAIYIVITSRTFVFSGRDIYTRILNFSIDRTNWLFSFVNISFGIINERKRASNSSCKNLIQCSKRLWFLPVKNID